MLHIYWISAVLVSTCSPAHCRLSSTYTSCTTGCLLPINPFVFIGEVGVFNCSLPINTTLNSDALYFSIRNEERLNHTFYRVISSDILQLRLPITNASYDSTVVSCHIGGHVLQQLLLVDYPPRPVRETTVLVRDWRSITITWELGTYIHHPLVHTRWRTASTSAWTECDEGNASYCMLGPGDFREDSQYSVDINVTNNYTRTSERTQFDFQSGNYVQPGAVSWLLVRSVDSRCVEVEWNHTHSHKNLLYRLSLRSISQTDQKTDRWTTNRTSEQVCGLRADSRYNVSVSAIPARGGFWSVSRTVNFTTSQDCPEEGAMLTEGGFTEEDCRGGLRIIYVYLVPPDESSWNGQLTNYTLVYVPSGTRSNMSYTAEIDSVFHQVLLSCTLQYDVYISVYNNKGGSPSSHLHIPRQDKVPLPGIIRIESENKTFKLIWDSPVKSFTWTLFWCRGSHGTCQERLRWKTLGSIETAVAINYTESWLCGVSLNTSTGSSGIVWSQCRYDLDKVPGPPGSVWVVSSGDYSLTVRCKSRVCEENTWVTGFILQHCRERYMHCQETTIASDYSEYVISGLQGGVNYSVRLRQRTVSGKHGPFSQPVFAVSTGLTRTLIIWISLASSVGGLIALSTLLACLTNTRIKLKEKEHIVLPNDMQIMLKVYMNACSTLFKTHDAREVERGTQTRRGVSAIWTLSTRHTGEDDRSETLVEKQQYLVHSDESTNSVISATHSSGLSNTDDTDDTSCVDPYVTAGSVLNDEISDDLGL